MAGSVKACAGAPCSTHLMGMCPLPRYVPGQGWQLSQWEKIIKDYAKEVVFLPSCWNVATAAGSPFLRKGSTEFLGFKGDSPGSWGRVTPGRQQPPQGQEQNPLHHFGTTHQLRPSRLVSASVESEVGGFGERLIRNIFLTL